MTAVPAALPTLMCGLHVPEERAVQLLNPLQVEVGTRCKPVFRDTILAALERVHIIGAQLPGGQSAVARR